MIKIPVSFGELVDKLTILELKVHYIKNEVKLTRIKHELQLLQKLYTNSYTKTGELPIKNHIYELKCKLYQVNSNIWKLEDNIRNKEKLQEFDDDFISYARNIYKVNDKRARLKRQLNKLVNSEIIEEKFYQKYQIMTLEEINKQIEELPDDDPEFIIGWLIAQLIYVTTQLEDVTEKDKKYDA